MHRSLETQRRLFDIFISHKDKHASCALVSPPKNRDIIFV